MQRMGQLRTCICLTIFVELASNLYRSRLAINDRSTWKILANTRQRMRFSDLRGCRGDMPRGDRDREGQNSKNVTIIRARAKESEGERDRTLKQT